MKAGRADAEPGDQVHSHLGNRVRLPYADHVLHQDPYLGAGGLPNLRCSNAVPSLDCKLLRPLLAISYRQSRWIL